MFLKYLLPLLSLVIPLQSADLPKTADLSKQRKRVRGIEEIKDFSIFDYAWGEQYKDEEQPEESFKRFINVIKSKHLPYIVQYGKKIVISENELREKFSIVSLMRHCEHQLTYNNPNELHASAYHENGEAYLAEIKQYYTSTFKAQKCLFSAVNLGNIARAEGKTEKALKWYLYIMREQPDICSLEQLSLFAIGYPLLLDSPYVEKKAPQIKELLRLALEKNDIYVQTFKRLYPEKHDEAHKIIMYEN